MTQHTITDEQLKALKEIVTGDVRGVAKLEKCRHEKYGYEDCENCLTDALQVVLDTIEKQTESAEGSDIKPELDFIDYLIDQWIVMKEKYTFDYFRYCHVFHEQAVALRSRHIAPQKEIKDHE